MAFGAIASWLIPSVLSVGGALQQQRDQQRMAREQMAFQERMSSTQAQRAQEDFKKAGLNPALAYGTVASAPSGAQGTAQNILGSGVSSALSAKMMQKQITMLDEQIRQQRSNADAAAWDAWMKSQDVRRRMYLEQPDKTGRVPMFEAERQKLLADMTTAPLTIDMLRQQIAMLASQNVGAAEEARFQAQMGAWQRRSNFGKGVISSARILKDLFGGR